ncbi:hypothetical protein B0H14DRAFT_2911186, partial [Mycena olivaceomarginata]
MWLCLAMTNSSTFLFFAVVFCWEGDFAYPRLAPVAHISLYHSCPFVYPNISPLVSYISYTLPARTLHARTQRILLHS